MMILEVVLLRYSENLDLCIPEKTDKFNVDDFNGNFIIIDELIKEIAEKLGGAK